MVLVPPCGSMLTGLSHRPSRGRPHRPPRHRDHPGLPLSQKQEGSGVKACLKVLGLGEVPPPPYQAHRN